jgi:recombinational DNA repair protein RecR
MYDGIVQDLIDEFGRLPGIGPKSAQRITFHILQSPSFDVSRLATLLAEVREKVRFCEICGNVSEQDRCGICRDRAATPRSSASSKTRRTSRRSSARASSGAVPRARRRDQPDRGHRPEDLRITQLMQRLADGTVQEVILATNPNLEGEATATYLSRLLHTLEIAGDAPRLGSPRRRRPGVCRRSHPGSRVRGPPRGLMPATLLRFDARAWILFSAMALLWGMPYLFIKQAVDSYSPASVVAGRTLLGALLLLPFALRQSALRPAFSKIGWVLAFGAIEMAGPFLLLGHAEQTLPSGLTGLLVATVPLFAALVAFGGGDRSVLKPLRMIGLFVGFVGVAIIVIGARPRIGWNGRSGRDRRGAARRGLLRDRAVHRRASAQGRSRPRHDHPLAQRRWASSTCRSPSSRSTRCRRRRARCR